MPGLFAYKVIAYKNEGYMQILTPVSFVERDAKCSCLIYSNMFQQQFHKEMKVIFFCLLSSTPDFLSRPVSHINNSSKTLANLTELATEKHTSLQLALSLQYKRKGNKIHLLKRIVIHCEKDQANNFSLF